MNAHASDKTRILALAAVATLGFGLLQGARLLDLNTGPYSPSPYALVGLAADGLTFLVVAVLSYVGRIDRAKPLFVTAVVVSSIYAVLVASGNTNDIALIAMQVTAGMGWSLSILCWMEVFTSYRPRLSLPLIAAAYLIDTLLPPLTSSLFPGGRSIMLLASFVLSTVALLWCLRNNAFVAQQMKESVAPATSMAEALSRTKRAVAGTFAFSLICGFVIELDIHNNLQYAQTDLTGLFGIIAAVAMLAVLLVAKPRKANIDYITPITALCLVTILLYRSLNVADGHVAGSLMTAFLISFYVLLWLMFISEATSGSCRRSSCWAWPWASRGCRWRWGASRRRRCWSKPASIRSSRSSARCGCWWPRWRSCSAATFAMRRSGMRSAMRAPPRKRRPSRWRTCRQAMRSCR